MSTSVEHEAVLDEEIWRAWIQRRKVREAATARKAKIVGGIVMAALAVIGGAFYLFGVR